MGLKRELGDIVCFMSTSGDIPACISTRDLSSDRPIFSVNDRGTDYSTT
jgi:hypothetical protein